jgi:hypothetical protein
MVKFIVAIALGAGLGILGARYLFVGSWMSLIVWGLAGLLLGGWCRERRQAMINGTVFGFVVAFVFMLSGYNGSAALISRVPFFAILGVIGAICGLILGFFGYLAKEMFRKGQSHRE